MRNMHELNHFNIAIHCGHMAVSGAACYAMRRSKFDFPARLLGGSGWLRPDRSLFVHCYVQRPDIILIVLDTQRSDRLGCYGYNAPYTGSSLTPNLDRFSDDGALFEMAISPAQWTIPSHASLFTGQYPTTHQVIQSNRQLGPNQSHLAEALLDADYETVGFCNNPLVGVLNNGFKRGFDTFFNYGGAIPSLPQESTKLPWPASQILEGYTQFLRRISYPIQNYFARSDLAFRISLNSWLTPLWSRMVNYKGQNERSVHDVTRLLQQRESMDKERPLFLFLNLMETHLPFWPPGKFVDLAAPYFRSSKEARSILRRWNREAYRWAAPLETPLEELESHVLNDLYDAEVAYQDDYLGQLFEALRGRNNVRNTLTIIVSDHGEGLGEHGYFGHAFVAYQELIHVPLLMHWPKQIKAGERIRTPVSSRRIYHTILDAAGTEPDRENDHEYASLQDMTLLTSIHGQDPENGHAYTEAYPPINFAKAVERRQPELLERFRCLETRRALVEDRLKLIQLSDDPDEMFDLSTDLLELRDMSTAKPDHARRLNLKLSQFVHRVEALRDDLTAESNLDLEADEKLLQRLRGLGYIE